MTVTHMSLSYSLKMFVEEKIGIPAHIKFDGFEYPNENNFCLIEKRTNSNYKMSKLRESVMTYYRFQFGVFAESEYMLSEYQEELRRLFMFHDVPLYDSKGVYTGKYKSIEPDFTEVKISSGTLSNETIRHRLYFDLVIKHVHNKRRNK